MENATIYAVCENGGGGHEPMAVDSVWSTLAAAESRRDRLNARASKGWDYEIREWQVDQSNDGDEGHTLNW